MILRILDAKYPFSSMDELVKLVLETSPDGVPMHVYLLDEDKGMEIGLQYTWRDSFGYSELTHLQETFQEALVRLACAYKENIL
jgi:hypothetical protein